MVCLLELYKIKEIPINEDLKDSGDPARGDKGKDREKEFYFVDEPADPETGGEKSKVVYKRSFANMVKDIEAEAVDMQKLSDENPDDLVIYKIAEELKEEELEEANVTGTGASFSAGNSMAYMPNNAFKKKRKKY